MIKKIALFLCTIFGISASENNSKVQSSLLDPVTEIKVLQKIILGYLNDWEAASVTINGYEKQDAHLAFSPCGNFIAFSAGSTIKIGNTKTAECFRTIGPCGILISSACAVDPDWVKTDDGFRTPITSIAYSPCGQYIACSSGDKVLGNTIQIWSILTGEKIKTYSFKPDESVIRSIAYSPCSKFIAISQFPRAPEIIDVATGNIVKKMATAVKFNMNTPVAWAYIPFQIHFGKIAYSPCGKFLAVGEITSVEIFDATSGNLLHSLIGHTDIIIVVSFSACGKYIITGSHDKTVKIWNALSGKCVKTIKCDRPICSVTSSPCGMYLAIGSWDEKIKICELNTGSCVKTIDMSIAPNAIQKRSNQAHFPIAYSACGRYLAAGLNDKTVKIWNNLAKEIAYKDNSHVRMQSYAQNIESMDDGYTYLRTLASGLTHEELDELVQSLFYKNRNLLHKYIPVGLISFALGAQVISVKQPTSSAIQALSIHPLRNLLAIGSLNNDLKLFRMSNEVEGTGFQHIEPITSIAFTDDGTNILIGGRFGFMVRFDIHDLNNILQMGHLHFGERGNPDPIRQIACSYDSKYALVGSTSKNAYLVDLTNPFQLTLIAELKHNDHVNGVGFSADNRYCITGCENKALTIWDIRDTRDITKVSETIAHSAAINTIATKRMQPIILTGSDDKTAKFWNIHDRQIPREIAALKGHTEPVTCARFSPCERFALTASKDGSVRIWDIENIESPVCIRILNDQDGAIFAADCASNLDYIAAGTWEKGVRLWNFKNADFARDLSLEQLIQVIKVLKSTDEQALINEKTKKLLATLPENLQNYIQKKHALHSKFTREITEIITGYVGHSFAYNYQTEHVEPQANGCVIS